ncbi:OR4A15 [Branchiostoma lanceolatum]|uniref:OR4A15 protein n=1 Tax=Branchiostoma lanceolatum TaxID=7740 RepID=A0A8J9ZJD6_BRALA|nr:OR4A15 [Branchiostoma lanceolatum]
MAGQASGADSMYNAFRSLDVFDSRLSRGLQTAYLLISLAVSASCGLLLIYLVWKKEYLRKPRHFLRCNLAIDDIIFTACIIATEICFLFSQDDRNDQRFCWVQILVVHPSTISMFGTYLLMGMELYYFICKPLHYNAEVTTKRVNIGIVAVRATAVIFGIGPVVAKRLQSSGDGLLCAPEPINSTSASAIFRSISQAGIVLAVLAIFLLYYFVLKEARKQQERDENQNLWLCQTKAFKTMAPHVIVVIVSAATLAFVSASFRSLFNGDKKATASLLITAQVAKLLNITVSSMVNPIVYSFSRPEFRRALRELCGMPPDAPVAQAQPPVQNQGQDTRMVVFDIPDHGQGTSDQESTSSPPTAKKAWQPRDQQPPPSPAQTQARPHGQQTPPPSPTQTQAETLGQQAPSLSQAQTQAEPHGQQAPPPSPAQTQAEPHGQQAPPSSPAQTQTETYSQQPPPPSPAQTQAEAHGQQAPPPSPAQTQAGPHGQQTPPPSPAQTQAEAHGQQAPPPSPAQTERKQNMSTPKQRSERSSS